MPNAQLDQFMHALMWKAMPVIIVCGIAGILLRECLQWLERRAVRFGRDRRCAKVTKKVSDATSNMKAASEAPHCPACNSTMMVRTARRGPNAGNDFWGCPGYPTCRGTRDI